jgi:hypothetical protein
LAVALVLALCVVLLMIASCGSPTADVPQIISPSLPDDSPADVMLTPTNAGKATIPVQEEAAALLGMWADDGDFVLEVMAEFSVAGYTDAITRSVPISVPLAVIEELLALLESTPLEVGKYKPLFNHTDDFPSIIIAVEGRAGDLGLATESQGSRHIPWRVVVGEDHYVTYADTPAQALDLLDPYLAREVQEELFNLALVRDP